MIISQCSDIIFALYKITKSIIKLSVYMSGFPAGVENMAALSQYIGGAWGDLQCCRKIPVMEFI